MTRLATEASLGYRVAMRRIRRDADRDGSQLFEGGESSPKSLKRNLRIIQRLPRFHQGTLRLIESGPGSVQGNLCSSARFLARLERVAKFLNGLMVLVQLELVEDVRRHAEQR